MSETIRERKDMDPAYMWDLTSMYASDAAWEDDFAGIDAECAKLSAWQGKLHEADAILAYLQGLTDTSRHMSKLFTYASLRHSEDTRDPAAQSMYMRCYGKYSSLGEMTAFAEPEILSLGEDVLKEIADSEKLQDYSFYLHDLLRRKPHMLSKEQEGLLAAFSEALATPSMVSESLMDADMYYEDAKDSEGNLHEVSDAGFILLQTDPDRVLRADAFEKYYEGYKHHENTFASAYAGVLKTSAAEARVRGYGSSREMMMAADALPVSVYDNLINTVHAHMDTMYRYVRLRKRLLKLDDLHYYDVYMPLTAGSQDKYTYEQAQELVLKAVAPLGEKYCDTVRGAFRDRWIDVYPNKGKSGGAYSSGCYDSNPYILTNFAGRLNDVSTIAHEMGHSMHTWHTNANQPPQYADYSLFVAEVASTVNENLLIEALLKEEKDPARRLVLLNQVMEGFKGTVYRQTMFAEFEKQAHELCEKGEALNASVFCAMYEKLIRTYFGEDLTVDPLVRYEWSRIPHFYRPFYVYVYATGYSAAVALADRILHGGDAAVQKYLEFLSMGSSAYPLDELKHAGVDLTTPEPVETALKKFAAAVEEAEQIADTLGL